MGILGLVLRLDNLERITYFSGLASWKQGAFLLNLGTKRRIMGCNCKEDTYNGVKKYSDDGKPVLEQLKGFRKIISIVLRVILGILVSIIVIVVLPFAIVYVIFSAAFGKGVTINIKKLFRLNGGE